MVDHLIAKELNMKRFFIPCLLFILILAGCSKQIKLKQGTAVYGFAKEISVKLPFLDPDKNNVLVSTKKFKTSSGEVLEEIFSVYGKQAEQLKTMSADQIKFNVEQMAANMSEKRILLNEAEKIKVKVTQVQVDSVLNQYAAQRGGLPKFEEYIKSLGIGMDFVKRDIRTQLTIDRFFSKHFDKDVQVTDPEIQASYSEGKTATARHILLLTKDKDDSAKKVIYRKMEEIQARIRKGEDFARLAGQYSEDPGSAKKGGLVENFQRGDMVPSFDEIAFTLPIGGISGIVETEYGYHIIKVVDRKKDTRPFETVRAELKQQLEQKKRRELYPKIQALIDRLKQENAFTVAKF